MRTTPLFALLFVTLTSAAHAQRGDGFDLTVVGNPYAFYGESYHLSGTAYEVRGLADLRGLSGGEVKVELLDRPGRTEQTVVETSARTGNDGRYEVDLGVPERALARPSLRITVTRGAQSRSFRQGIQLQSPLTFDLLSDRRRYEPGETAHLWFRLRRQRDGAPVGGRTVHLTVHDAGGNEVLDRRVQTSEGGVAAIDLQLEEGAREGTYRATVRLDDSVAGASGALAFQVARRTVERLFVEVDIADRIVSPGGRLRGTVEVETPSGTPVAGATVVLQAPGIEAMELRTDASGQAPFRVAAPAHLAGDMEQRALSVRVEHPAHGALHVAAPFLLSRVRWRVLASAEAGGLVPGVATETFLSITDARGEPPPASTAIRVRGPGIRDEVRGTTDGNGLVALPVRVADGDYGAISHPSPCAGSEGIHLDVTLETDPPAFSRVCVPVSPQAELLVRVAEPFAAPGGRVELTIERAGGSRGEVLVEALLGARLLTTTRIDGARGALTLPENVGGVVELRARPVTPAGRPAPLEERGQVAHGVGTSTAVLVRPPDAFALSLEPNQDPYLVRDEAQVNATLSQASPKAWIAYVARDLAAHGGEVPWRLDWLGRSLDRALVAPAEGDGVLVRAALAALVTRDFAAQPVQPLVIPPWGLPHEGPMRHRPEVLRDALSRRAELIRRGAAQAMVQLERIVASRVGNRDQLEELIEQRGGRWVFRTDAPSRARIGTENLGGETVTTPMLKSADPGFSFDTVGRRIARTQLVRLLVALRRLSDPSDRNAARAVAGQPPERWLSRLVELGTLPREALIDPWGNPFTFRRAARPALIFSAEAAQWELASAGPDGRAGTGDDVRDPFARVLAEGTPYAVASGEDQLMLRLSALAPGPQTLLRMAQAYDAMSLAADQERTRGPVSATVTEGDGYFGMDETAEAEEPAEEAMMNARGRGGLALAQGARRSRIAGEAAPSADADAVMDFEDDDGRPDQNAQAPAPPPSPLAAMGSRIRERFPATLHFDAGRPLDGEAATLSFQLADALTTYRVEAIAWTASGWTTTASTEVRVDQRATVDAPVPPYATAGDVVRLPIRVDNRSGDPLRVQISLEGEDVTLHHDAIAVLEVPARRGREIVVAVRLPEVGTGQVVVRAATAEGAPLDAVRRPLRVWPDARVVRSTVRSVIEGDGEVTIAIPDDATARGPAQLRVVRGSGVFGPLDAKGLEGAWAQVVAGESVSEPALAQARQILRAQDPRPELRIGFPAPMGALAVATLWSDGATEDVVIERAFRVLADQTPTGEDEGSLRAAADVLRALAATRGRRPALAELRGQLIERLVDQLAAVVRTEDAALMATAAAALALTDAGDARDQAGELLRRLGREEVRFGEQSFVEGTHGRGTPRGRMRPTADAALAHAALGERAQALRFVRHLLGLPLPPPDAASVGAAAAALLGGSGTDRLVVRLDGEVVELAGEPPVRSASFRTPDAGEHTLAVDSSGVALVITELRYARPWSASPAREARFQVTLDGELGARDVRAGLALTVRSRQPRLVRQPVAYIDLPAGAELDQPTREALEAVGAQPTMEGRTLRVALPPLAPGRRVRLPLPLRWAVGGTLRGLGVTVVDEGEVAAAIRPVTVLPSRALEIPDAGPEPESPEAELPEPEPPTLPEPIPLLRRLAPVASRGGRARVPSQTVATTDVSGTEVRA